ncbi:PREDICTED: uncharacterized protein LOC108553378 [Eufriesea mexicana]|uniref:uncharacterized protein LOC108553378 n=1 Tax=Eufriesea mexicana TaxID=516756 RepID=UPI00083C8254|nr:PREDICTED: uncharacterized protein LOC108553378 [Eufriesea mexicana]
MEKAFSDDTIFNTINHMFITLKTEDEKETKKYLDLVINKLIEHMKLNDSLFEKMYEKNIYCGSFYKLTKIEKPNEFDLNIILKLPVNYNYIQILENRPGYVQINIKDEAYNNSYTYKNLTDKEKKCLHRYVTPPSIVNPDIFRSWIESIIYKVLDKLPKFKNMSELKINDSPLLIAHIKIRKSGPAFTVIFNIPHKTEDICIDLVPALTFHITAIRQFTSKFHILEKCRNDMWFAIPIQLYNNLDYIKFEKDIYWRISFSLQENEILRKYGNIKTVIRQMKKFRDIQGLKNIASYYIENLFLNKETDINMDKISRTLLLFKMLEELYYACERQEIKWFWNEKYNLLSKIGKSNLYNISQRLKNIINDIKNNFMDQFIIAKYILSQNEVKELEERIQNNNAYQEKQENNVTCNIM